MMRNGGESLERGVLNGRLRALARGVAFCVSAALLAFVAGLGFDDVAAAQDAVGARSEERAATSDSFPSDPTREEREKMRRLLRVDSDGVQTRYPAVAKIVGRAESTITEDSYATVPLYYGTGEYVAQYGTWGIVLTNWHVVSESNKTIEARFPSGKYPARAILRDEKWDLAALIIPKPENILPLPISLNVPYFNDRLWVGGYGPTEGLDDFVLRGGRLENYVSLDLPSDVKTNGGALAKGGGVLYETEMIDVGVRSGDSGGPVFNEYGELAGCLWGSDKKSSMGTNGPRLALFVMEAIQEASKLRARKILDAEATGENPDVVLTLGQAPNLCSKSNAKLASYAEEDAFAIVKQLMDDDLSGVCRDEYAGFDVRGIDARLYPVSTEPLYVSGNGVDTPESLRRLGAIKTSHVADVAKEYWRRNPDGLPPSPPIYSPSYLGLQVIMGCDFPELIRDDSFASLDARSRELAESSRTPKVPTENPLDDAATARGAEFRSTAASRPVSGGDGSVGSESASSAPAASKKQAARISQLQAYSLFCVILVLLCSSAILLKTGDSKRGRL